MLVYTGTVITAEFEHGAAFLLRTANGPKSFFFLNTNAVYIGITEYL